MDIRSFFSTQTKCSVWGVAQSIRTPHVTLTRQLLRPQFTFARKRCLVKTEPAMSSEVLEATGLIEAMRVAELRSFLSSMGKNKSGLKKDLIERAKELLSHEYRPEHLTAIRELHSLRHTATVTSSRRSQVVNNQNVDNLRKPDPTAHSPIPEVQMIKLPFYLTLETIIAPVPLVSVYAAMLPTTVIKFSLTASQWTQIKNHKRPRSGQKSIQVVLRLGYTNSLGIEDDQYPPKIAVFVNNKSCPIQARYSAVKEGGEPSRPCCPINLTPFITHPADNSVAVIWENLSKCYSAAVYLVQVYTSAELLQQLQNREVESKEQCKQKICEKLRCDPKNEIATTGLQVSLICPLAKTRMSTPCRAQTCAHLQCFDAEFYLQMNERKPRWTCPVCHKLALFDTLQIDSLLREILQSTDESVEEIEYLSNGSWKAVGEEKLSKHQKQSKDPNLCTLNLSKMQKSSPSVVNDVVDLCSTDEDDDNHGNAVKEIVLTHVRSERVCFSKGAAW